MRSRWEIALGWSRTARRARFRRAPRRRTSRRLLRQLERRLEDRPVEPFVYRDFGSLVSLGEFSTIGSLMGFLAGKEMLIEGYVARLMYRSLYKMHETALHGPLKIGLDTSPDCQLGAPSRM
jgi:NADH dehydrogenase